MQRAGDPAQVRLLGVELADDRRERARVGGRRRVDLGFGRSGNAHLLFELVALLLGAVALVFECLDHFGGLGGVECGFAVCDGRDALVELGRSPARHIGDGDAEVLQLGGQFVLQYAERLRLFAGHKDPLALSHQRGHQVCDGVGLAGAGRAFDDDAGVVHDAVVDSGLGAVRRQREQRFGTGCVADVGGEPVCACALVVAFDQVGEPDRHRGAVVERCEHGVVVGHERVGATLTQNQSR